jgi:hypothetical protein
MIVGDIVSQVANWIISVSLLYQPSLERQAFTHGTTPPMFDCLNQSKTIRLARCQERVFWIGVGHGSRTNHPSQKVTH